MIDEGIEFDMSEVVLTQGNRQGWLHIELPQANVSYEYMEKNNFKLTFEIDLYKFRNLMMIYSGYEKPKKVNAINSFKVKQVRLCTAYNVGLPEDQPKLIEGTVNDKRKTKN